MIIPHRDPGKCLVTQKKIEIGSIGGQSLTIIIQGEDCSVWQRDTVNALTIAILSILRLVYVVAQMQNIVDRVFASSIAIGIEKAEGKVTARVHGQANLGYQVTRSRGGLGAADWASVVRIANRELIIITSVGAQTRCFDLQGQWTQGVLVMLKPTLRV